MILTSLLAPYLITWNDHIARVLVRPFGRGVAVAAPVAGPARGAPEIVLLGHFRIAQAVLDLVEAQVPDMKARITLIDYDPNRAHGGMARGFRWEYGDLPHPNPPNPPATAHARLSRPT